MAVFGAGLKILIRGFAERISSSVNDFSFSLQSSGASATVIRRRVEEEIATGGRVVAEMRRFGTAMVPGFAGELVSRYGRDTLATKRLVADLIAQDRKIEADRAGQQLNFQGIDAGDMAPGELPMDIPPDADLDQQYYWVAIHDNATCEVCEANSEMGAITLAEWSEIGEPRSGACAGEWRCRCELVPADNLPEGGIPGSIQLPKN